MTELRKPPVWTAPKVAPYRFETARLVIREYEAADAPALFTAIDASRTVMWPWLPWVKTQHRSVEESAASIERFRKSSLAPLTPENNAVFGYVFGVFDRRSGELVAGTGFNRMSPESHNAETGYWVRADRRGEGIAGEACAGTLSWGFTPQDRGGFGFRRVHIFASVANAASCRVPRKLGLREIMHSRQDRWVDDLGWCDSAAWDVLAEEWDIEKKRMGSRE